MEIKREAFAVYDCMSERWTDRDELESHLIRCGEQRKFAIYVHDGDTDVGVLAVSNDPAGDVDGICVRHHIVPTTFSVFVFGLNAEQVDMLSNDVESYRLDTGVKLDSKPDEFMDNMMRLFGNVVSTVNGLRENAPDGAEVTFSCSGNECEASLSCDVDLSDVDAFLDIKGVGRDALIERVGQKIGEDTCDDLVVCASENPTFAKVVFPECEDDLMAMGQSDLHEEIGAIRVAINVEHESEAILNHRSLVASAVVVEKSAQDAINCGDIATHFGMGSHTVAVRAMNGCEDVSEALANSPASDITNLYTRGYFIEYFNESFPTEAPVTDEEVASAMEWTGMRGHFTFFPDDPHILCVATRKMLPVIFVEGDMDGVRGTGVGYFLTKIGIRELLKTIVRLRFAKEVDKCASDNRNMTHKVIGIDAISDRYVTAFREELGEDLIDIADSAVNGDRFHMVMSDNDYDESPEDMNVVETPDNDPDVQDVGGICAFSNLDACSGPTNK